MHFPFGKMEIIIMICLCCHARLCFTGKIMLLHPGGMLTLEHSFKLPQAIKLTKATCHLLRNVEKGIRTTVRDFSLSLSLPFCVYVYVVLSYSSSPLPHVHLLYVLFLYLIIPHQLPPTPLSRSEPPCDFN